jgi:hypothetical protein
MRPFSKITVVLLLFFLKMGNITSAQERTKIKGKVIDSKTG